MLIDSGSTHNFIQDFVAYKLGVGLQSLQEFKVFIGSGDYLVCREVMRQVSLIIQDITLNEDLYVLSMEGANIVLGIQWLEKLGAVTCDCKKLSMEFELQGKKIMLQGDLPSQVSTGRRLLTSANYGPSLLRMNANRTMEVMYKKFLINSLLSCRNRQDYHHGDHSITISY